MTSDENIIIINMLLTEIKEDENSYIEAIKSNKEFWQLKEIQQRIKFLKETLRHLENATPSFTFSNGHS